MKYMLTHGSFDDSADKQEATVGERVGGPTRAGAKNWFKVELGSTPLPYRG
jgi:hypothetical protein